MKFKIYCINLYERNDRYKFMKNEFKKYNLDVCFIRNYKHKSGGRYGCFDSHIQCLKDAKKNKLDICLIFEDDIELDKNCNKYIQECLNFIQKTNTDMLFGSGRILYLSEKIQTNFYSGSATGTFTIFLTKHSIRNILKKYKKYINTKLHYDLFLLMLNKNIYVYENNIAHLKPFGSDNNNWGENIFSKLGQFITNYTFIHFKINNVLLFNIFRFLILNDDEINHKIKVNLINFINKKIFIKANSNIGIKKYFFTQPVAK